MSDTPARSDPHRIVIDVLVRLAGIFGVPDRTFTPAERAAAILDAAAALDELYRIEAPPDSLAPALLRRAQEQQVGGAWAGSIPFFDQHAALTGLYRVATGGRDLCHDARVMEPDEDE